MGPSLSSIDSILHENTIYQKTSFIAKGQRLLPSYIMFTKSPYNKCQYNIHSIVNRHCTLFVGVKYNLALWVKYHTKERNKEQDFFYWNNETKGLNRRDQVNIRGIIHNEQCQTSFAILKLTLNISTSL